MKHILPIAFVIDCNSSKIGSDYRLSKFYNELLSY